MTREQDVQKKWFIIDASKQTLGHLSVEVANILRGKHKPSFTPHIDDGDFVVIINAKNIVLTGDKLNKKMYYNHSGYPGGLRTRSAKELMSKNPEELVKKSIWGMVPHNRLGRKQIKKLFIYNDEKHLHMAQKPIEITLEKIAKEGIPLNV